MLNSRKVKDFFSHPPFVLWLLVPLVIYFSFSLYHLTHFKTADEVLWIAPSGSDAQNRIPAYWKAIGEKNWGATMINDKPGITLAWVSGTGLLWGNDESLGNIHNLTDHMRTTDTPRFEFLMFRFRLPILILNALFAFFFFYSIKKLTKNKWMALLTSTLLLLCPVLLGISQIINPDSLLWIFSFASLLSYLNFLQSRQTKDAALASLFLGLSLATKYTSDIFMPFFFLSTCIYIFCYYENWQNENQFKQDIKKIFLAFPLIIVGALAVFAILMPAVFVSPYLLFEKTILYKGMYKYLLIALVFSIFILTDAYLWQSAKTRFLIGKLRPLVKYLPAVIYFVLAVCLIITFINWSIGHNFLNIKELAFDIGRDKQFRIQDFNDKFFLELRPIVFATTPFVLFLLFFIWVKSIFKKSRYDFLILINSLFLIFFIAAVLRSDLLITIRYSILLYPMIIFTAAIALCDIMETKYLKNINKIWIFLVVILISVISLWGIKPFYFNYTNDLFPKKNNIAGAWGYGGYEAAQYLNSLPGAKSTVIWSDYDGVCEFFVGRCMENKDLHWAIAEKDIKELGISYYVKTRRGSTRFKVEWKMIKKKLPYDKKPVWSLQIDGRPKNYIDVLKVNPIN
jgi:hypothetical protein